MSRVTVSGLKEAQAELDEAAQAVKAAAGKPVFVGTSLFYGRFQERGTRRGVRPRRYLEQAANTVRSRARAAITAAIASGRDPTTAVLELARRARGVAAARAPSRRGKLRRSIKVQVGGAIRRR